MESSSLCTRCSGINLGNLVYSHLTSRRRDWDVTICRGKETTDDSRSRPSCPMCQLFITIYDPGKLHLLQWHMVRNIVLRNPKNTNRIIGKFKEEGALLAVRNHYWHDDSREYSPIPDQSLSVQSSTARPIKILDPQYVDFDTIRKWLSTCLNCHEQSCALTSYSEVYGLMVINVQTKRIESAQKTTRYVALSYVWGKTTEDVKSRPHSSKCDTERLQEDPNALPNDIPATIEHAMMVVAELGFQFLWVDRYCVPQGKSNAKDRHCQIKQMDKIYHGADLTIIAAAGEGPQNGLPGVKGTLRKRQAHGNFGTYTLVSTMASPRVLIHGTAWYSRAWTYQEAICSRRRLFFTDEQVFFECQEMSCRETVEYMWPLDKYRILDEANINTNEGGLRSVHEHIEEYTQRQLTYDSDALNAILGVLQLYSAMSVPVFHFWGLPMAPPQLDRRLYSLRESSYSLQDTFLGSLCWYPKETAHRRLCFPTWSWTGWSCRVYMNYWVTYHERVAASVSIGYTDGCFKPLEDAFHQNIKLNKLQDLSGTLRLSGKAVKLRTKIFPAQSSAYVTELGEPLLFAWPVQQDEMYGDVQYMIPVDLLHPLDEQAVESWTEEPPELLGVLIERGQNERDPDSESDPDGVFVLVVLEVEKSKYERVGHLRLKSGLGSHWADERGAKSVSTGRQHNLDVDDDILRRKQWEAESDIYNIDLI
ncbi:hypothetical protein FSST1_010411 [Fusarium sambucinum]